jgi:glycerate 2-kinase
LGSRASYLHRASGSDVEVGWRTLRTTMRVLVISAGLGDLGPAAAGTAIGSAWDDLGHQVAVVPIGIGGQGLVDAVSGIRDTAVVTPQAGESSAELGRELAAARDAATILVDLTGECPDDAGAGLLTTLGERDALAGHTLVGVVREDERDAAFLGVRGVAARRSYASGTPDIGAALAGDAALARLAAGVGLPDPPAGAGAGNGLAFAVLVLGGVLRTGPQAIGELVGIERSLEAADLVVLVTDVLDFGGAGIAETRAVAAWAEKALVPCVAIARRVQISSRELRTLGVESAYELGSDGAAGASRVARTWNW